MKRSYMSSKAKPKTAEELDGRFDEGEDIISLGFDVAKGVRPGLESQRINLDLPRHFLEKLDREAEIRGITRQSLIKTWLFDRLEGSKPTEKPKPFVSHLEKRHRTATVQSSDEMGEDIKGVVERAWPNDYQGKRYYFVKVNGLQLQTTDAALGETLLKASGQEIRAMVEPSPKPGRFYLKSFEYVGQEAAMEDPRLPEDDAKPATKRRSSE